MHSHRGTTTRHLPSPEELESILADFTTLSHALIDASSMIYMNDAGFLWKLSNTICLYAPKPVIKESGLINPPITPIGYDGTRRSNDEKFIAACLKKKWPVISEDKTILMRMRRAGRQYYNAVMMLNFLFFRTIISEKIYTASYSKLQTRARYSTYVWEYSARVFEAIQKRLDNTCQAPRDEF